MIKFNNIMQSIEDLLRADPNIASDKFTITRSEHINEDSGRTPWIGIYRNKIGYQPNALGPRAGARNWLTTVMVDILVQSYSMESGKDAENQLEEHQDKILDVLENNRTLKGNVQTIVGYDISYQTNSAVTNEIYFQMATITVTMEVRA